jgi:hypothetical protein
MLKFFRDLETVATYVNCSGVFHDGTCDVNNFDGCETSLDETLFFKLQVQ